MLCFSTHLLFFYTQMVLKVVRSRSQAQPCCENGHWHVLMHTSFFTTLTWLERNAQCQDMTEDLASSDQCRSSAIRLKGWKAGSICMSHSLAELWEYVSRSNAEPLSTHNMNSVCCIHSDWTQERGVHPRQEPIGLGKLGGSVKGW